MAIFTPLIVATLYMGVQPNSVFDLSEASVDQLVRVYQGRHRWQLFDALRRPGLAIRN